MKTTRDGDKLVSAITIGLTVGSVGWTGWGIYDLLDRQTAALLLAAFADIGWLVFIRLEWRRVLLWKPWVLPAAGWAIAALVAALLAVHGHQEWGVAGLVSGPLLVVVTKLAWFGMVQLSTDPAAPTREQEASVHRIVRESAHSSALAGAERQAQRTKHETRMAQMEADLSLRLAELDGQHKLRLAELKHAEEVAHRNRVASLLSGEVAESREADAHFHTAPREISRPLSLVKGSESKPPATTESKPLSGDWAGLSLREAVARADAEISPKLSAKELSLALAAVGLSASDASIRSTRSALRKLAERRGESGTGQYL